MSDQIFYRALRPAWAFAPLSGEGAAVNGGRWNAKGTAALYLASDPMTALAEYNQDLLFRPVTLVQYHVAAAKLADLENPELVERYAVEATSLNCDWYRLSLEQLDVPSWTLAGKLMADEYHGMRYASRINGAICVCLWLWNESGGCTVWVTDLDGRLPHNDRSWPSR